MEKNYFNTTLKYLDNVSKIKELYIGLDVSTNLTGIAILFNRQPVFLDVCNTQNKEVGDGNKMVVGASAIFAILGKSGLLDILKKMKELNHNPWIIVAIENGIIPNVNTIRKLSLWSGMWAAWFILIFTKNKQKHKVKFISPREWQERLIPWNPTEQNQSKFDSEGKKLIKLKSLKIANNFMSRYKVEITDDNVADALNIARMAYVAQDFSTSHFLRSKAINHELKIKKQIPILETRKLKLTKTLQDKRNKKVLALLKKGLKAEAEALEVFSLETFANKTQLERWCKINQSLKDCENKLKEIKENKKIKNKR